MSTGMMAVTSHNGVPSCGQVSHVREVGETMASGVLLPRILLHQRKVKDSAGLKRMEANSREPVTDACSPKSRGSSLL